MYTKKYQQMAAAYPQVLIAQRTLMQLQVAYVNALESFATNSVALQSYLLTDGTRSAVPARRNRPPCPGNEHSVCRGHYWDGEVKLCEGVARREVHRVSKGFGDELPYPEASFDRVFLVLHVSAFAKCREGHDSTSRAACVEAWRDVSHARFRGPAGRDSWSSLAPLRSKAVERKLWKPSLQPDEAGRLLRSEESRREGDALWAHGVLSCAHLDTREKGSSADDLGSAAWAALKIDLRDWLAFEPVIPSGYGRDCCWRPRRKCSDGVMAGVNSVSKTKTSTNRKRRAPEFTAPKANSMRNRTSGVELRPCDRIVLVVPISHF